MKRIIIVIISLFMQIGCLFAQTTMTLQQCIDYAISHNIDLKQQKNIIDKNTHELSTSKQGYLPTVMAMIYDQVQFHYRVNPTIFNFDFLPDFLFGGVLSDNVSLNGMGMGIGLDMPLFDAGKTKNQILKDKYTLRASELQDEHIVLSLQIGVSKAYLQVLYCEGLKHLAESQVQFNKDLVKHIRTMYEEGISTQKDLEEAKSILAKSEYQLVSVGGEIDMSKLLLAKILTISDINSFVVSDSSLSGKELNHNTFDTELPNSEDVDNQPSILSQKEAINAAGSNIIISKSYMYPKVSFVAGAATRSYYLFNDKYNMFMRPVERQFGDYLSPYLGVKISIPIYVTGQLNNNVFKAKNLQRDLELQLEENRSNLLNEMQQIYSMVKIAWDKYQAAQLSIDAAKSNLKYQQDAYDEGRASLLNVQQASINLIDAQQKALQNKYEYLIYRQILHYYTNHE